MKTENKKDCPVASLLRGTQISPGQKAGIWAAIILTLCAIAVFIWLIAEAAAAGSARGIVMSSSLILFAVGVLYFLLARINNPRRAWAVLYVTVPLAVAAFVVSLYLDDGANAPDRRLEAAEETEMIYQPDDGTVVNE